jgi:hypothetical protein
MGKGVTDHANRAEGLDAHSVDQRGVGEIGDQPAAEATGVVDDRASARRCVSAADRHLCALGDQQAGDLPADAAAGARDENDPVMQSETHGHGRAS